MRITPWSLHERKSPDVIFRDQLAEKNLEAPAQPRLARRVYIGKKDFERQGYTAGCPKCDHEMRYGPGRTTANHSEACRNRIMSELAKTVEGQARLSNATARLEKTVNELGEKEMAEQRPVAQGENGDVAKGVRGQVSVDDVSNPFRISGEPSSSFAERVVEPNSLSREPVQLEPCDPEEPLPRYGDVEPEVVEASGGMDVDVVVSNAEIDRTVQLTGNSLVMPCVSPVSVPVPSSGSKVDREDQRRKLIMGGGPIGELDASGGDGPRTPFPLRSKAGPVVEPSERPGIPRAVDGCARASSGDCSSRQPVLVDDGNSGSAIDPSDADGGLCDLEKVLNGLYRDQVREDVGEILQVVKQLGGSSAKYLRERKRAVKQIVSEIYSPPRVTAVAKLLPELRCVPGFALDLTTTDEAGQPWDFDNAGQRKRARAMVEEQRPMLLIGSPMCTAFSAWQHINRIKRDPTIVSREYVRAMVHIRFCMELYALQHAAGRYFLHEHPAQATSWAGIVPPTPSALLG